MNPSARSTWLLAMLLVLAACSGAGTELSTVVAGSESAPANGSSSGNGSDAGASSEGGAASQPGIDPFAGAPAFATQTGSASHNAGKACVASGCHLTAGGLAPQFLVGGTVYADYLGTKPAPGVEVRVVDGAGHATSVYSGPEGNFYVAAPSAGGLTFPLSVGARDGTTTRPMITSLVSTSASCGQTGCHVAGGGPLTSTGNYYPVHVP
jgi:hypothetical protein